MTYNLFLQLLRKDLAQFRRIYKGKFFDTAFLFFTNVLVFGYFMPQLGLPNTYGAFILIGAIASFGLFDIVAYVAELIVDIEGDQTISFTLAMPVPSWVVFFEIGFRWALNTFFLCIPLFIVGKLLLWNGFDLGKINYLKLALIYPTTCLFFGAFSLWIAGLLKNVSNISSLFLRVINPLFMFGCYFFTWQAAYNLSPYIGYALFLNPMIYVMEGMRSAALGSEGYLPFWTSFFVLWAFILVLGSHALSRLKKRLDCV